MRFVHTADLHLGRRLAQMPLEEDLAHVLGQLADVVREEGADALVVAGDVFDSPNPSEAALRQWDGFLRLMAGRGVHTLVVSGNHDSGARLAYGATFAADKDVYIAGELTGEVVHVEVGGATFWLVPFVRPADVRAWAQRLGLDPSPVVSYDTALRLVLDHVRGLPEFSRGPNVCVAHQFVTCGGASPVRSDSERLSLGTLDNVDSSAFDGFDYVALGHMHRPQRVGRDACRYAGSPLKLSSSEIAQSKSFAVVDVGAPVVAPAPHGKHFAAAPAPEPASEGAAGEGAAPAGGVSVRLVPVRPLHDFRAERGSLAELVARAQGEPEAERLDYVRAIVTDDSALDVVARLRHVWPNLEQVTFDNSITRAAGATTPDAEVTGRSMQELFSQFFSEQAGREPSEGEAALVREAFERVMGEGERA
ncbi:MAG: exonuclease SbcCD subunit D [Olsenella sp.]|jgi:exonuclease SbcD